MLENEVFRAALAKLEKIANERPGLGTALRAMAECDEDDLVSPDSNHVSYEGAQEIIGRLATALVETADQIPNRTDSSEYDERVQQLLIDLVTITVGEGDDLAQIVELQREARDLLRAR